MKTIHKKLTSANAALKSIGCVKLHEEMTQREVADALGITQAAVAFIEQRALNKFRQKLMTRKLYSMDEIL